MRSEEQGREAFEATFPDHIWLDVGEDAKMDLKSGDTFRDLHEVTWSEDNATGYGVKYVRAPDAGEAEAVAPTDAAILHRWDTHVGHPDEKRPLTDDDKIGFARACIALALSPSDNRQQYAKEGESAPTEAVNGFSATGEPVGYLYQAKPGSHQIKPFINRPSERLAADYCEDMRYTETPVYAAPSHPPATPAVAVQAEPEAWTYENQHGARFVTLSDPNKWHQHDKECFKNFRPLVHALAAHPKPAAPATGDRQAVRDFIADYVADNWSMRKYDLDEICERIQEIDVTQAPATADEAVSDETLGKIAYQGFDSYWTEDCAGKDAEAWIASAKAVRLALRSGASAQHKGNHLPQGVTVTPWTPIGLYDAVRVASNPSQGAAPWHMCSLLAQCLPYLKAAQHAEGGAK